MTDPLFLVSLSIRIDWSELDYFGHVNNVMFFKYIQASRVHYWENIGLNKLYAETKKGPMLVSASCQFKRPLFFPGTITILARMIFIKNTSFSFHHRILNEDGEIVAEAEDVMVMYDFNTNEKIPFPEELKKIVEKLENKTF